MAHAPTARCIIAPFLPLSAALRHAARLSIAALLASEFTRLLGLEQGYWAVITAIIVVQGSQNGTLGAAIDRLLATIAGGVLGVAVVWAGVALRVPEPVRLVAAVVPFAVLAMQRSSFRLAPLTAAIVVMISGNGEQAMIFALDRLLEISIGSAVGVATAHFVLPGPARATIRDGTASTLAAHGDGASVAVQCQGHRTARAPRAAASVADERRREGGGARTSAAHDDPRAPDGAGGGGRCRSIRSRRHRPHAVRWGVRRPARTRRDAKPLADRRGDRRAGRAKPVALRAADAAPRLADLHEQLEECLPAAIPREGFRPWMPIGA